MKCVYIVVLGVVMRIFDVKGNVFCIDGILVVVVMVSFLVVLVYVFMGVN